MTKLKILLACEQPLPSTKRAGRPNYTLEYLSRWGHEVTVICPHPAKQSPETTNFGGSVIDLNQTSNVRFGYLPLEFDQFSILTRFKIMRSMKKEISREVSENSYDIIRANGLIPSYASISGAGSKVPVYSEICDVLTDEYVQFDLPFKRVALPVANRIQKRVARDVTLANVDTPAGRRRWAELGFNQKKIVVNPNGVDAKHFSSKGGKNPNLIKELGFPDDKDRILLVWHGDIGKNDGVECLLNSMVFLENNFVLAVIGKGPEHYMNDLKQRVFSLGLESRVTFTGWIDYFKLPVYLDLADLGVSPSLPTAMSHVLFFSKVKEYIAMGKNFVATETEGLKSMIGDHVGVYVVNPADSKDLANKIKYACSHGPDDDKVRMMKEIALKIDWENIVRKDNEIMIAMLENAVRDASEYDLKLI